MDAKSVRRLVAARWPDAMQSPVAQLCQDYAARDEADLAIGLAKLQAIATDSRMRADAMQHAIGCIEICEANAIEYDAESIGHNIESNFPDLDPEICDEIAEKAIANRA